MNDFTNYKGLSIPKPVGVKCGYCPAVIFKHNEMNGRLYVTEKEQLPICARCRVLKGKWGKNILRDKSRYEKDVARRGEVLQQLANEKAKKIAQETQIATKSQIKDNK